MLVVSGNLHTIQKLEWEDGKNDDRSVRELLSILISPGRIFSIVQAIDNDPDVCDFTKAFNTLTGAVALDLDKKYTG